MNKRINELAEQANGCEIRMLMTNSKLYTFLEKDLEKFAELIVRECALQCVHNEDMDLIEKHFGVEE